jgi:hypothetical protein
LDGFWAAGASWLGNQDDNIGCQSVNVRAN